MSILHIPEVCDPQNPEHVRLHSSNSYKNATPYRENATSFSGTYRLAYNQEIPSPPPLPVVTVRETNGTHQTHCNNHFYYVIFIFDV